MQNDMITSKDIRKVFGYPWSVRVHNSNAIELPTWKIEHKKLWYADGTAFSMYLQYDKENKDIVFRDFTDLCWEHEVQKAGRCLPRDRDERVDAIKILLGASWKVFSCQAYNGQPVISHTALKFTSGASFRLILTDADGEMHDEDNDVYHEFWRLGLIEEKQI